MNIEEAIEELKLFINSIRSDLEEDAEDNFRTVKAIETLLTAYEKEKGLSENEKTFIQLGEIIGEKNVKDKIKQKIEELKDGTYDAKIVLQSLLVKEFSTTITKEELEKRWKE